MNPEGAHLRSLARDDLDTLDSTGVARLFGNATDFDLGGRLVDGDPVLRRRAGRVWLAEAVEALSRRAHPGMRWPIDPPAASPLVPWAGRHFETAQHGGTVTLHLYHAGEVRGSRSGLSLDAARQIYRATLREWRAHTNEWFEDLERRAADGDPEDEVA